MSTKGTTSWPTAWRASDAVANRAAASHRDAGDGAPRTAHAPALPAVAPKLDAFPRFFLTGIAATLSAGATWGAIVLLRIAAHRSLTSVSIFEINAHAQAQIDGWVGMFVMGFAYTAFPRFWRVRLRWPGAVLASWALLAAGIVLRALGEPLHEIGGFAPAAVAGVAAQLAAVATFAAVLLATRSDSAARATVADRYIAAAVAWFVAAGAVDLFHVARMVAAATAAEVVRQVEVWQFPLRDLQIHGLAMMMIFGVSSRQFPAWFGTPVPDAARARRLWLPLQLAVALETLGFAIGMGTGRHAWLGVAGVAALVLAVCAVLFVANERLWTRVERPDRSLKFVRAAQVWLVIALAMLVLAPAYFAAVGTHFSHAWYGAMRHAITVGFISLTIMGVAARVVSAHAAPWAPDVGRLRLPFALVNLGCALRVTMQVATDFSAAAYPFAGASGVLEVTGLAIWGTRLARAMLARRRAAAPAGLARG